MPVKFPLRLFDDADQAVLALGRARARVKIHQARMNLEIAEAKENAEKNTAFDCRLIARLESEIEGFWLRRKHEVKGKSWRGTFGKFGQRKSTGVRYLRNWNAKKVLAAITGAGEKLSQFLRQKPTLNKRAILDAPEGLHEDLRLCGVDTDRRETFFVEPDEAAIAAAPPYAGKEVED